MVKLSDERLLELFADALSEWSCDGFIVWKNLPREWLSANIPEENTKSISKLMFEYFQSGGKIDQVKENRFPYDTQHEFHFDFRFSINGKDVYIETVMDEMPTGPTITIVNMHDKGLQKYEK